MGNYDLAFHSLYREDGTGTAPTLTVTTNEGKYTRQTPLIGTIDYGVTDASSNNWTTKDGKIVPNGMQSCGQAMAHGDAMATDLQLGIRQSTSATYYWTIFDNFRLYYYGSMSIASITDVETLVVDGAKACSAVYNIHGQKVGDSLDGLPKGLYICNGKKIMVK